MFGFSHFWTLAWVAMLVNVCGTWWPGAALDRRIRVKWRSLLAALMLRLRWQSARLRARYILWQYRGIPSHITARSSAPAPPLPGSFYGLPGITDYTEQVENNDGISTALAQATQSQVLGLTPFKQTDVIFKWDLDLAWTNTVTPGTSAITTSGYFPFNLPQTMQLKINNTYPSIDVSSGVDVAILNSYRPFYPSARRINLGANPAATWAASALPQANLDTSSGYASTSTAINYSLELPASIFFDVYYDLLKDGTIVAQPVRTLVSPQYMSSTAREVMPNITYAAGSVGNLDNGPFNIGAGTGTYAGSVALGIIRRGIYQKNDPTRMPVIYNWQYTFTAKQVKSLSGVSKVDLPIGVFGQILSLYVRLFDPSANGGLGAPINLSNVNNCNVLYGSGLYRFQDTPRRAQRRFVRQHGFLPPVGVVIWDMATDEYWRRTNAQALNTLTTAGVLIHIDFTGAQSSTAYAVVGVEALQYVE